MARWLVWSAVAGCGTVAEITNEVSCDALADRLQGEYDTLIGASSGCETNADCHAPFGACTAGVGGCQEAVNVALTQQDLASFEADAVAELQAGKCGMSPCDCYGGYEAECADGECALVYVGYSD